MGKGFSKKVGTAVTSIIRVIFLATINTYASQQELDLFDRGYEFYKKCQKTPCLLRLGMNGTRSEARIAGGAEVIVA